MMERHTPSAWPSIISEIGRLATVGATRGDRLSVCIISDDAERLRWRMLGVRDGWALDFYGVSRVMPAANGRRYWRQYWHMSDIGSAPASAFDVVVYSTVLNIAEPCLIRLLKPAGILLTLKSLTVSSSQS